MHARDGLHAPTISVPQTTAINCLHLTDVGVTIARQRDFRVVWNPAWHARHPKQFVAEVFVRELMNVADRPQRLPGVSIGRRDEFEQSLGEIGRNVPIG